MFDGMKHIRDKQNVIDDILAQDEKEGSDQEAPKISSDAAISESESMPTSQDEDNLGELKNITNFKGWRDYNRAIRINRHFELIGFKVGEIVEMGKVPESYEVTKIGKKGRISIKPVEGGKKKVVNGMSVDYKGKCLIPSEVWG